MSIDTIITITILTVLLLSVLIVWSIGETRRHQHRQAMRRYARSKKSEDKS